MSRILPIKNGLDDRFINQTDVITENALEQVINGQGGGGQKVIIIEPNLPASESGFPVNSGDAWTAQEVCTYLNITQDELDTLFSGELQVVFERFSQSRGYSYAVTGDPSDYNPNTEAVEGVYLSKRLTIVDFVYVEGYDADTQLGVPGLKIISLAKGNLNLYKLNEKYGTSYHYEASM